MNFISSWVFAYRHINRAARGEVPKILEQL